jgi:hypothetical protein
MAVPKKRTTRGVQGQRRSHHALKPVQLQATADGTMVPRRLLKAVTLGLIKLKAR